MLTDLNCTISFEGLLNVINVFSSKMIYMCVFWFFFGFFLHYITSDVILSYKFLVSVNNKSVSSINSSTNICNILKRNLFAQQILTISIYSLLLEDSNSRLKALWAKMVRLLLFFNVLDIFKLTKYKIFRKISTDMFSFPPEVSKTLQINNSTPSSFYLYAILILRIYYDSSGMLINFQLHLFTCTLCEYVILQNHRFIESGY